jgi:hypothetical protein
MNPMFSLKHSSGGTKDVGTGILKSNMPGYFIKRSVAEPEPEKNHNIFVEL